ncbi:lipoprotein [Streptomyces caelestis]|uniref:Lipoprotein n=1 Tax=Streptomyces caelestis TaxID=36816 RepID=A0A0M8QHF6_9ACTN|nr:MULTISPECIES: hypothetical protein [Streptomyces]KOT32345.1 lipoprotein [Streptomyces caelestis]
MGMTAWRRAGVCLTAAAVVVGVAGCQDGAPAGAEGRQTRNEMTKVLQAAFENTSEAKSAKVRMTMTMAGSGSMELSGVQGWDPGVMDVTMKTSGVMADDPDVPEKVRMIMVDDVVYMDAGAEQAAEMDGKRWMRMDFAAMAEEAGDAELRKRMAGGLENLNQDPAQQIALLLESPSLKHVGPEEIDGVRTQHYEGTLSFEEMADADESFGLLSEAERQELLADAEKSGMKGYDTQVWVNEDDYPVKMVIGMRTPQGTINLTSDYSDYGARAEVETPPARDTFDFVEMLKELEGLGADSGAGLSA